MFSFLSNFIALTLYLSFSITQLSRLGQCTLHHSPTSLYLQILNMGQIHPPLKRQSLIPCQYFPTCLTSLLLPWISGSLPLGFNPDSSWVSPNTGSHYLSSLCLLSILSPSVHSSNHAIHLAPLYLSAQKTGIPH